jgi:hypothetical protein
MKKILFFTLIVFLVLTLPTNAGWEGILDGWNSSLTSTCGCQLLKLAILILDFGL